MFSPWFSNTLNGFMVYIMLRLDNSHFIRENSGVAVCIKYRYLLFIFHFYKISQGINVYQEFGNMEKQPITLTYHRITKYIQQLC